jgi:hypothetical protein
VSIWIPTSSTSQRIRISSLSYGSRGRHQSDRGAGWAIAGTGKAAPAGIGASTIPASFAEASDRERLGSPSAHFDRPVPRKLTLPLFQDLIANPLYPEASSTTRSSSRFSD